MMPLSERQRRTVVGTISSAILATAGFIALRPSGVLVASVLVTLTVIVFCGGLAYASDRRLGMGVWLVIAATLPLFGLLYAIGASILRYLGPVVAGGALIVLAGALGIMTATDVFAFRRHVPRH